MNPRPLLAFMLLATSVSSALADRQKSCPDPNDILVSGACVKRQVAARNSALEGYQQALDQLDKNPRVAFEMFDKWCKAKHGPSCTQLGMMHKFSRGRVVRKNEAKASELFQQACDLGDGPGCRHRGMYSLDNSSGGKDEKKLASARTYLEKACTKQEPFACSMFGKLLEHGMGGNTDEKRANALFKQAHAMYEKRCPVNDKAGKRDGEACWQYGYVLKMAYGETKDEVRALRAYQLACDNNHGLGCLSYIDRLKADKKKTVGELEPLYKKTCLLEVADACTTIASELANKANGKTTEPYELAKLGCDLDPKECGMLGEFYRLGWAGLAKDESKATDIYKSSCDAGEQYWCYKFAVRLHDGIGVTADKTRSLGYLESACTDKIDGSCEQLVRYLRPDEGGSESADARAQSIADATCKRGSQDACFLAGWGIRYNRRGKKVDDDAGGAESLPLFEGACSSNDNVWNACYNAGRIYERGLGVPADAAKALARFHSACYPAKGSGYYWGCKAITTMTPAAGKPSAAEILRARARACAVGTERDDCTSLIASSTEDVDVIVKELDPVCVDGGTDEFKCFIAARQRFAGTSDDKKRAFELLDKQCNGKKQKISCIGLADAHFYGVGTPKDIARAEGLYDNLCDDTYGYACLRLSEIAREKKDDTTAFRHAERACKNNNGDGCNAVGYAYHTGKGVEADTVKAFEQYKRGCELGTSIACANVAENLRYGIAGKQDLAESYKLYKKACEASGTWGCAGEAHYLATGRGGAKKDVKLAIEKYRKACDGQGEYESCVALAAILEEQKGSPPEISGLRTRGRQRVEKAAADGNPAYMYWLGTYYRDGIGSPKDAAKAREWFAKSCDHFDALGCIAAGAIFADGKDPGDLDKARAYYEKGCSARADDACKGRDEVLARIRAGGGKKPGEVSSNKRCGCAGAPDAGGPAVLVLAVMGLARRRRRQ